MPRGRPKTAKATDKPMTRSASTPEARENQLISLAVDLAEQQLRDGTASSQVITHYLKLATAKERLERERLAGENELIRAKTKAIRSAEKTEELYRKAIDAMGIYSGNFLNTSSDEEESEDFDE